MALAKLQLSLQDEDGNVVDGATVTVTRESDSLLPPLYSDRDGTVPLGNPYVAASGVDAGCFVAGGAYRIDIEKDDQTLTRRYAAVGTNSEFDTSTFQAQIDNLQAQLDAFEEGGYAFGKQSIWMPASAMTPRLTNGPSFGAIEMTTNKNMVKTLDFDNTTQEFAQFDIRMPKSWNEGTVTFIPVWSHAATTVNFGAVWGLDAVAVSDGDALDAAFGTAQTSVDTGGTTNTKYEGPESSAITIAGSPAAGDLVMFRIHRDPANGSDNMAIDARLHGVLVLYVNDATNDN